jgi:Cu-Zn family superoxide dismutase
MNAITVFDPNSSSNIGKISGTIQFHQCSQNTYTLVIFKLSGFPPNTTRGVHIHTNGDMSKGCESACDHYNPFKTLHGSIQLYGSNRHVGDLCSNITSDVNGDVYYGYYDDLVNLSGEHNIIGRMIVIHGGEDDLGEYRYDNSIKGRESGKTGNAGKRVACAVIGITSTDFH